MDDQAEEPLYHVLLVGIDAYPAGYKSLAGCVADIDEIESLLLDNPGVGLPKDRIRITRLAAPRPNRPSSSRFQAQTLPPTRANLLAALRALAGPEVQPADRVLIFYSGHGHEVLWEGSPVWHEALVPTDGRQVEYLFDVELNALVSAIAARTDDLTVVLDCCHSGGATRDLPGVEPLGATRHLGGGPAVVPPPDLAPALPGGPAPLLRDVDPKYLAVMACHPNEKANEGKWLGEQRDMGILTFALVRLLKERDARGRAELRWADLWPALLDGVAARCDLLRWRRQHPWLIGRGERRVFGGPWKPGDAGYRLSRLPDGRYRIAAGTLMGLTVGAEVAVYGKEPARFPTIGSDDDQPVGRLRVVTAERAECTAEAAGAPFPLPEGARGRLVKPGQAGRLRVALKPADAALAAALAASPLLALVPPEDADADVEIVALAGGGWIIGNDVEPALARVPQGETRALRAGLESYYRFETVLHLARNCQDPQLSGRLDVRLLDCSDAAALAAMSPETRADPPLPEVGRDSQGIYTVATGASSCIRLTNRSDYDLEVAVLNCSAGGLVEFLGKATLRKGARHVLWLGDQSGTGFPAWPDELPDAPGQGPRPFVTDRMVAIGTTRQDPDWASLPVDRTVQQVVDENLSTRGDTREPPAKPALSAPAELWTATVTPLRILR